MLLIVPEGIIKILDANNFSGYEATPVISNFKGKGPYTNCFALQITGRCDSVEKKNARTLLGDEGDRILEIKYGFEVSGWYGSDLFTRITNSLFEKYMTQNAKDAISSILDLQDIILTDLAEKQWMPKIMELTFLFDFFGPDTS